MPVNDKKAVPEFSVNIPVYNEASAINSTIENILETKAGRRVEILACDGHPLKTTLNEIKNPEIVKISSAKGRGTQMNAGAKKASGRILVFLHADTKLPQNAFARIEKALGMQNIRAGAFNLGIDSQKKIYRIIEKISSLRSRITRVPYGDQVFFTTGEYFHETGGFADIPIMEDVDFMERIKKRKEKIFIIHDRVKTSSRKWDEEGVIFCTLRNWFLITCHHMGIRPDRLVKIYYRDKNRI